MAKINCFNCINYTTESCTGIREKHPCLCLDGNNLVEKLNKKNGKGEHRNQSSLSI